MVKVSRLFCIFILMLIVRRWVIGSFRYVVRQQFIRRLIRGIVRFISTMGSLTFVRMKIFMRQVRKRLFRSSIKLKGLIIWSSSWENLGSLDLIITFVVMGMVMNSRVFRILEMGIWSVSWMLSRRLQTVEDSGRKLVVVIVEMKVMEMVRVTFFLRRRLKRQFFSSLGDEQVMMRFRVRVLGSMKILVIRKVKKGMIRNWFRRFSSMGWGFCRSFFRILSFILYSNEYLLIKIRGRSK